MISIALKVGGFIVTAATTFVVSSAGNTLGRFFYDGLRDIFGVKNEEEDQL